MTRNLSLGLILFLALNVRTSRGDEMPPKFDFPAEWSKAFHWRSIGPANMSGRIVALAVYEADPSTWWAATASGGLLKTVNNGTTFEHQFDRQSTVSLGDVAVAQSNKDIVWVGTGEQNPRNSASYGDGVYKSTDGGKTWKNMGLERSFQIGRVLIHPKDPDIVYVGALGRLWGQNEERGLYKTTDGGKSWERILYVDKKTGIIDVKMSPADPDTLLVATYERERDFTDNNDPAKKWGEGSGLHRTTDGGKTWKKVTKGLPTCKLGRIGLDWYRKDPNVVFAIVESENYGKGPVGPAATPIMGINGRDGNGGAELTSTTVGGPADKAGLKPGDVVTDVGGKAVKTYLGLTALIRDHKPGQTVKVMRVRDKEAKVVELTFVARGGMGGGGERPYGVNLGGQRENAQRDQGRDGYQYGGVYKSSDGGETWTRINSVNPRPMYFSKVRVDPSNSQYVYVLGIALYRSSDGGETVRGDGGKGTHADNHALWIDPRDGRHMILGTDGGIYVTNDRMSNWDHLNTVAIGQYYHVATDSRRLYRVYGGLQDNGSWGGPGLTRGPLGPINEDWFNVNGGDGYTCRVDPKDDDIVYFTSQWGNMGRRNLKTREVARIKPQTPRGQPDYRWNWNTPYLVSAHDSKNFYCAAQYVFRSTNRGADARVISPEITATNKGTATALAESALNANLLYVGSDDGKVWVTSDGGKLWVDVTKLFELPGVRGVASIEASRHVEGRAYVVFDGHRNDDDKPYVFMTEDKGKSWKSIHAGLPAFGSTRVLREDIHNPNLLYVGTEFGLFASLDRGQTWGKIHGNLPTVAVHEIAQPVNAPEIVAATHGRSLWAMDASALRQAKPDVLSEAATVFKPATVMRWAPGMSRGRTIRRFVGENPPPGVIYCALTKDGSAKLSVVDDKGKVVAELASPKGTGLHRVAWDLGTGAPRPMPGQQPQRPATVTAGSYRLVLSVDGKEWSQPLKVENDPSGPPGGVMEEDDDEDEDEKEMPLVD